MSDTRKPDYTFLLRKQGKKANKVELFAARNFKGGWKFPRKYRLRVGGKWFSPDKTVKYKFFTKWEIRDLIWRSISI